MERNPLDVLEKFQRVKPIKNPSKTTVTILTTTKTRKSETEAEIKKVSSLGKEIKNQSTIQQGVPESIVNDLKKNKTR